MLVRYRVRIVRPSRTAGHPRGRVNNSLLVVVIASGIAYGTPLLFASLGELLAERSGVLNLGVEGMMLVGAVMGFWTVQRVHIGPRRRARGRDPRRGPRGRGDGVDPRLPRDHAAGEPDRLGSRAHDLRRRRRALVLPRQRPRPRRRPGGAHSSTPVFPQPCSAGRSSARSCSARTSLVYLSWALRDRDLALSLRTRPGLNVRAVGESPAAADAMGINVAAYRYAHTLAAARSRASPGRRSRSRSRRSGSTASRAAPAGSRSRSSSSRSGGPSSASSVRTSSAPLQALAPQLQARHISLGPTVLWTNALPYVMTIVVLVVVSSGTARSRLWGAGCAR